MPTICGTVQLGSWPSSPVGEDTAVEIKFGSGVTFDAVPRILAQVAAIDAQSGTGKGTRVGTWASDASVDGFRLHARSWADSVTHMLKVSWVATTDFDQVQLGSEDIGGWPDGRVPVAETRRIEFPRAFPCAPDVAVSLASLDAQGDRNIRLWSESVETGSRGFSLRCGSWGDSVTWGATASWIACASPGILQAGSMEIDGWPSAPLRRGEGFSLERTMEVRFGRAFDAAPTVALALAGIDADRCAPTRIDTWADEVRCDGFRLHIRSWEDSVTWRVRCSWVAVPSSSGGGSAASSASAAPTVTALPSHLPPSDYVVQGKPLGQGWWGVTHCTRHIADGRKYAVKTCKHSFQQNAKYLRQELENLVALPAHDNLLRYHACIVHMDRLHIITEYLDAFTLAVLLPGPDGAFPRKHATAAVLRWMAQLFDGLAALHKVGIVHRDLHGDNVLVERDVDGSPSQGPRAVRIIDFGVAKVYGEMKPRPMSGTAGCWQYFSPERRRGDDFDDRDDVWAAGCHLTELATGRAIRKRRGCGADGVDFATNRAHVASAVGDCGNSRCRQLAEAVLVMERSKRPCAAAIREMIYGQLLTFAPGKRTGGAAYGDGLWGSSGPETRRRCSCGGGRRGGGTAAGAGPSGGGRRGRTHTATW